MKQKFNGNVVIASVSISFDSELLALWWISSLQSIRKIPFVIFVLINYILSLNFANMNFVFLLFRLDK